MNAAGEHGEQRCFAAGDVGVGGDDAGVGDEEAGTGMIESLQIDDGGLGAADDFFEREFGFEACDVRGYGTGGDGAIEGGRNGV